MSSIESILELLVEEATLAELQGLLRTIRQEGTAEVRVPRRREDVRDELRKALAGGIITQERLLEALRDAEENGNQHVMYYSPLKGKGKLVADGEAVAEAIFERKNWRDQQKFPKLTLIPSTAFTWADFRIGLAGKPHDWVAKFYDREVRHEDVPEDEVRKWIEAQTGTRMDPTWNFAVTREVPYRSIVLARWNHPDVLELRVSRRGVVSRTTIALREDAIWTRIEKAVKQSDLTAWDLTPVRNNMMRAEAKGATTFRTSRTNLRTVMGTRAEFHRPTDEEALSADDVALRSIVGLIDKGGGCEANTVNFLADQSGDILEQDLQVIVGAARPNEIVIRSEASAQAVDYVTDQFRAYR